MNQENYQKALDDLSSAREAMQAKLKSATAYEGIVLLQVVKQLADTQSMIALMLDAAKQEDSLLNL